MSRTLPDESRIGVRPHSAGPEDGQQAIIRSAAGELSHVRPGDALAAWVVICQAEPGRFERAALRRLGELVVAEVDRAARGEAFGSDPVTALRAIREHASVLDVRPGVARSAITWGVTAREVYWPGDVAQRL
jgi:hypothetical protein